MLRLTRKQSREIDRIAIEDFGIPSIVLMENAARSIVDGIADLLPANEEIAIVCGPGNNGGDGLAVARHLRNRGHAALVILTAPPEQFKGDAAINLQIVQKMKGCCRHCDPAIEPDSLQLVQDCPIRIDAMFGTGLSRPLGPAIWPYVEAINWSHSASPPKVIAIDVPSGLDADTGLPLGKSSVRAHRTITMATEKTGFANPAAREWLGQVIVADIGVPRMAIERAAAFQD